MMDIAEARMGFDLGDSKKSIKADVILVNLFQEVPMAATSLEWFQRFRADVNAISEHRRVQEDYAVQMQLHVQRLRVQRAMLINARSFLFSLDNFVKIAEQLSIAVQDKGYAPINAAIEELNKDIPGLRDTRNSAHHPEQRVQRLGKQGKKEISIIPDPYSDPALGEFAEGSLMLLATISGDRLLYTNNDGTQSSIPVTQDSLTKLENAWDKIAASLPRPNWKKAANP